MAIFHFWLFRIMQNGATIFDILHYVILNIINFTVFGIYLSWNIIAPYWGTDFI